MCAMSAMLCILALAAPHTELLIFALELLPATLWQPAAPATLGMLQRLNIQAMLGVLWISLVPAIRAVPQTDTV